MSAYRCWFINRTEDEPITFEGTLNRQHIETWIAEARHEGYRTELIDNTFVRVVFERHPDGRPWIYREIYPDHDA